MTQSEKRLFLIQSLLKERPEYRRVETSRDPEGQRQLLRGLMNVRPPQAADPDFLRVQDAYLQAERYDSFLRTRQGQKLLFLELGVRSGMKASSAPVRGRSSFFWSWGWGTTPR